MSDIVIKTEHLSKYYNLGVINNGTLFRDLQTWWALKRGKKDPHSRVGENKYDSTKEGFWALKDLDIEIKKGDRIGIIGKNGAGKSTLLKILSRITAPTEGIIKIKGRVASLLEVGTGFHGELTGRENIYLNGAILGMKRHEVNRKIDEIIAFSEIEQHIDTPVKRYSSGMYVRLAFAVAAHLDSEILIADEVLAVGDASFQKKALGKMNDLSTGEGRTVLFVSHQMNAVKNLCNKGIILEKGRILYSNDSIDNCINFYTNSYISSTDTLTLWKNDNQYKHPCCTFNTISVVNQNDELIGTITRDSDDEIFIKMIFTVKEISSILNIGLRLLNSKNECTLNTWLKDGEKDVVHTGLNTIFVKLPKDHLNLGEYKVIVSAGLHQVAYVLPPEFSIPILKFRINGALGISLGDDVREGAMTPIIQWEDKII